ncbi:ComEA family DNA-binding protein [Brevibacillus sp. M2.1A]|uniref:ComEA family DNA-binding protein n=1 Tax=Brevibacillus sp. M2.1A TaxID=2738980 RepID=UPI00156AA469
MRFFLSLGCLALVVFFGASYYATSSITFKLDINTSSYEDLTRLPGIGEKLAQEIIRNRPISSWEQLDKIGGIGERRMQLLKERVIIR